MPTRTDSRHQLESLGRPALKLFIETAVRAGQHMTDRELELLQRMLWSWNQSFGLAIFIAAGVRARLKDPAAQHRRTK